MTQDNSSESAPVPVLMGNIPDPNTADAEKNKALGIIAYIGLLCIVPLLAAKDSPFAKYHANQGLVLLLFAIVLGVASGVPILGHLIRPFAGLAIFVLMIMGMVAAAQGEKKPLPLIGGITLIN